MTRCRATKMNAMKISDLARALALPLTQLPVLFAMLMFFGFLELAFVSGVLGLFLAFLFVPATLRYLMHILDAQLRGQDPAPPDIDLFLWFGSAWSIFPAVHLIFLIYATYILGSRFGVVGLLTVFIVFAAVLPASLAVLAITRSPLESLNPKAIGGLIRRCGLTYWIAPSFLLVTLISSWLISATSLPGLAQELVNFFFIFACYAVVGATVRPQQLHKEVDIPEPLVPDEDQIDASLSKERTAILNHAYGFTSRGNRDGGFKHLYGHLEGDPEPDTAWRWFFEQMLRWEIQEPALLFGQQYLSRLLNDGDYVEAVKLIMRCRLVNEAFKPLAEDRKLALEAAEHCHNDELISILR
jgi:hypothetical protein